MSRTRWESSESWDNLEWEEVSMGKALRIWANNRRHLMCKTGGATYYYHGESDITISPEQVDAVWYIAKM